MEISLSISVVIFPSHLSWKNASALVFNRVRKNFGVFEFQCSKRNFIKPRKLNCPNKSFGMAEKNSDIAGARAKVKMITGIQMIGLATLSP